MPYSIGKLDRQWNPWTSSSRLVRARAQILSSDLWPDYVSRRRNLAESSASGGVSPTHNLPASPSAECQERRLALTLRWLLPFSSHSLPFSLQTQLTLEQVKFLPHVPDFAGTMVRVQGVID